MNTHALRALPVLLLLAAAAPAQETPAPPAPGSRDDPSVLEDLVSQARPRVEKARGLSFKDGVPVAPITREQFVDRYMKDMDRMIGGADRLPPASRLLSRLGILPGGSDLRALVGKYMEGNIAANYDPEEKRISFLPGPPRSLQTMVHEMTHALDDQRFDMKAQMAAWNGAFDRMLAYGALCEGDAESVELRFISGGASAQQPLDGLKAMADGMATAVLQGKFGATPPGIVLAFKSQYTEGLVFAETLRRTPKGEEAVNAAFRAPPVSTEEILHPEKYLAAEREAPVAVTLPAPPEGATALFGTTLGELGARIVLLSRGLPKDAAATAAAGWGGDAVALLSFPAGEAVVWVTAWDTERDATEFHAALETAFPVKTGTESEKSTRFVVQRGTTVEFVEAPLDAMPAAMALARGAAKR